MLYLRTSFSSLSPFAERRLSWCLHQPCGSTVTPYHPSTPLGLKSMFGLGPCGSRKVSPSDHIEGQSSQNDDENDLADCKNQISFVERKQASPLTHGKDATRRLQSRTGQTPPVPSGVRSSSASLSSRLLWAAFPAAGEAGRAARPPPGKAASPGTGGAVGPPPPSLPPFPASQLRAGSAAAAGGWRRSRERGCASSAT